MIGAALYSVAMYTGAVAGGLLGLAVAHHVMARRA